ncbi:MAG: type III secretion system cytoplasmic ring protein SctQ [Parachlamydiales bacterium]|nr:type III secretion system cytoplasmic ring protein SctQ [Parachlamydiales bacterium]
MEKNILAHLRRIDQGLIEADAGALMHPVKPFQWDDFSSRLSAALETKNLEIQCRHIEWKKSEDLQPFFSSDFFQKALILYPLTSYIYLFIDKTVGERLSSDFIAFDKKIPLPESMAEGFFHYLLLQTVSTLEKMDLFTHCIPKISEETPPLEQAALLYAIEILHEKKSYCCQIAIPASFTTQWRDHLDQEKITPALPLPSHLGVTLQAIGGYVTLEHEQIFSLKKGDFIILDRNGYDPKNKKGSLILCLGNTPLYHAKITQNRMKIIDFANYEENKMENNEPTEFHQEHPEEESLENVATTSSAPEKSISLKNLPISLSVEVIRFNVALEKLMKLQPGNFLELPIHPTENVHLSVNGKIIGKGELIQLGDTLGVRIIDISQ